jgi:hypothetical protein
LTGDESPEAIAELVNVHLLSLQTTTEENIKQLNKRVIGDSGSKERADKSKDAASQSLTQKPSEALYEYYAWIVGVGLGASAVFGILIGSIIVRLIGLGLILVCTLVYLNPEEFQRRVKTLVK